jgi:exo-1,4-beta-D-glucosaminidase
VAVDNLGLATQRGLSLEANVYGLNGRRIDHRTRGGITLRSQQVATNVLHPAVPAATKPPKRARTYFVELLLRQHGQVVDRNVYWLSTQRDAVNWRKTIGMPQATMTRFANLRELQRLPAAHVRVTAKTHSQPGADGANRLTEVTITNPSRDRAVAFFLRADIRRATGKGSPRPGDNLVRPTFWSDNDITLWPGESETLQAAYRNADLSGSRPVVTVFGWNVARRHVSAG